MADDDQDPSTAPEDPVSDEDADDQAMKQAMGFTSFGGHKPPRPPKRKHDALADVGTGANSTVLAARPSTSSSAAPGNDVAGPGDGGADAETAPPRARAEAEREIDMQRLEREDLERLAQGVRTPAGDIAYFKASFLEDPWARLEGRLGNEQSTGRE